MTLKLNGSNSGSVSIDAPADTTGGADITFKLPVADGSSGQALTTNASGQLAFGSAGLFTSYALLCDEKSDNTNGGTATSGSWYKRDLNTEIADPAGIVSLSSDQFTLQAGNYLIKWQACNYRTLRSQTRLYDSTNSAVVGLGNVIYAHSNATIALYSHGMCRVTPSGATVYELQNRVQTTNATYGNGVAGEFDGSAERYAFVEIYKEA